MARMTHTYLQDASPAGTLIKGILSRLEPGWSKAFRCRIRDWREGGLGPDVLIDQEFAARLRVRARRLANELATRGDPALRDPAAYLCKVWWNPGFTRGLEGFGHAAARFGIESRHPWCDQRVVEFFLRTPMEFKVRNGWTKYLVRAAYAEELGSEVAWHSGKDHLGWMVTEQVLKHSMSRVDALLRDSNGLLTGRVDAEVHAIVRAAWANRDVDRYPDQDGVLYLATLCAWLGDLSEAVS